MQNKIIKFLLSPFLFCLTMGSLGILAFVDDLRDEIQNYPYQVVWAFMLGLAIGLAVFVVEQMFYNRWRRKHHETSRYKRAWVWKVVYLSFLAVGILFDEVWKLSFETTYLVVFCGSIYLLTLSYIFFRMRNHPLLSFG